MKKLKVQKDATHRARFIIEFRKFACKLNGSPQIQVKNILTKSKLLMFF